MGPIFDGSRKKYLKPRLDQDEGAVARASARAARVLDARNVSSTSSATRSTFEHDHGGEARTLVVGPQLSPDSEFDDARIEHHRALLELFYFQKFCEDRAGCGTGGAQAIDLAANRGGRGAYRNLGRRLARLQIRLNPALSGGAVDGVDARPRKPP